MIDHLILVPTPLERELLEEGLAGLRADVTLECCGFGPIVAAARTARLIAALAPRRVLLVGIAGSLSDDLPPGSAWHFSGVACHGVGAGSAAEFVSASDLGWRQWEGCPDTPGSAIGDQLPLSVPPGPSPHLTGLLLSACAASASEDDVRHRRRLYPTAVAEDMEGFAVAAACHLGGVPLGVVRGISNVAGDRDPARWLIREALAAAAVLARESVVHREATA